MHLLCRALQLAPLSYRHFQLTHNRPDKPLEVSGHVWSAVGNRQTLVECPAAQFNGVAELAAAMQRFAPAEALSLYVDPRWRSIIIDRTDDLPVWRCHCEAEDGQAPAAALQACYKCAH